MVACDVGRRRRQRVFRGGCAVHPFRHSCSPCQMIGMRLGGQHAITLVLGLGHNDFKIILPTHSVIVIVPPAGYKNSVPTPEAPNEHASTG